MSDANIRLPEALNRHPDLDSWLRIESDETITVLTGKVEIGQGIRTVVAQIAADELDVSMARMRVVLADTGQTADEGYTAGSNSTRGSGGAIRQIAAEASAVLLDMAAQRLDAPLDRLVVDDGVVIDPATDKRVSYWQLQGGRPFQRQVTGRAQRKQAADFKLIGTSVPRLDLPHKIAGEPVYVDDMTLPRMLHGRVVRPPHPTAQLEQADIEAVRAMPGVVTVVRDGSFLGVAAEREEQAVAAANALRATTQWREPPEQLAAAEVNPAEVNSDDSSALGARLSNARSEHIELLKRRAEDLLIANGAPLDEPVPSPIQAANAAYTIDSVYTRPFQMHGALGPSAALVHFQDDRLTVWTHSQGVFPLRAALSQVLDMDEDAIRVIHTDGPGCYGHNGADDVALDAALLARLLPGRPVLLKWTRADEHGWEPYGPAMVVQIRAGVDSDGQVVAWNHDVWSYSHSGRPRYVPDASGLLAAQHLAYPWPAPPRRPGQGAHNGGYRNADPLYTFANRRIVKHFVAESPVRTSSLRSLGAYANVFAIESAVDELALAAQDDPVGFRLRHLDDERAKAVIQAAAERIGWQTGANQALPGTDRGRGIAFAQYKNEHCYAAVIIDVHVDRNTGVITLEHAVIGGDAGQIINPDGLSNQLEGGLVQAASWTLKEAVPFTDDGRSVAPGVLDWEHYPVLRFNETPTVETVLLNQPGAPALGAGEATQGPSAAAIANAVFAAVGVRLRDIPFTPERVLAALSNR